MPTNIEKVTELERLYQKVLNLQEKEAHGTTGTNQAATYVQALRTEILEDVISHIREHHGTHKLIQFLGLLPQVERCIQSMDAVNT